MVLKDRFLDKGYEAPAIEEEIKRAEDTDRRNLIHAQPRPSTEADQHFKWSMLTSFSTQHRKFLNIVRRHWEVLRSDRVLGPLLPEKAKVIFRGAPSLRLKVAPNVLDPPVRPSFFHNLKGFYPCRKCRVCKLNHCRDRKILSFSSTTTGARYNIRHFCTCETKNVVYMITCPCGKQYIGRTIRTFAIRVSEHITNIIKGKTNHSVPKHYLRAHDRDPSGTTFSVIDKFVPNWRGSNNVRGVSQQEVYWIYQLKTYMPYGLNVDWDINSFINRS